MNPPMYKRVRNYLIDAQLTDGFEVQSLLWNDSGKQSDRFMVFRPNGGSAIRNQLGSEYYVLIDVISPKGVKGGIDAVDERVQAIIDYVQQNPMPNDCIGHIENIGGIPSPVPTEEGRLVYRLQFAVIYGE